MEFINIVEEVNFKRRIDHSKGEIADKFYVIYFGNVSVVSEGLVSKKFMEHTITLEKLH